MARILRCRGVRDEDFESFLHPCIEKLADPFLLPDMTSAVERILSAAERGERITVYGDYDADGITATAIFVSFFGELSRSGCGLLSAEQI